MKSRPNQIKAFSFNLVSSLLIFSLLSACSSGSEDDTPIVQDQELKAYLDRFEEEASMRGFPIDLSATEAIFVDEIFVNGQEFCGYGINVIENGLNGSIRISTAEGCWGGRSDLEKENLMFHEIGHALYNRPHSENKLPNGISASLMCGTCDNFSVYNEFTLYRRDYYLNELLRITQDQPLWGEVKSNFVTVWEDNTTSTTDWVFSSDTDAISGEIDNTFQITGEFSLVLESNGQGGDEAARWTYSIDNPQIPQGSSVRLELTVKSEAFVSGEGVSLVLRALKDNQIVHLVGTEKVISITGNITQRNLTLDLPDFSAQTTQLDLLLVWLPGTSGKVFFDDMRLQVAND